MNIDNEITQALRSLERERLQSEFNKLDAEEDDEWGNTCHPPTPEELAEMRKHRTEEDEFQDALDDFIDGWG
jgi:hypothetical protein